MRRLASIAAVLAGTLVGTVTSCCPSEGDLLDNGTYVIIAHENTPADLVGARVELSDEEVTIEYTSAAGSEFVVTYEVTGSNLPD